MISLQEILGLSEPNEPFPWQNALLDRLTGRVGNRLVLDVPTGLGKTSVMAAWLVALASGADLPRRLVYVVDRRAVVDQATREAERLRDWVSTDRETSQLLGLQSDERLPISTLRGQFADNGQWLRNPSMPAIVIGTVDMIGSRLLFQGYGVSRKMRPYHAGFLGAGSLFIIDEAHLVPPFEALLERVVTPNEVLRGDRANDLLIPQSVLISLSATGRGVSENVLRIDDKDLQHPVAGKRLRAIKRLRLLKPENDNDDLVERLATEAWKLSGFGTVAKRIIVFCTRRTDAMKVEQAVAKLAKADKKQGIPARKIFQQLFVGSRRVRERQELEAWLEAHGFLAGSKAVIDAPAFVFATSAGEVGVDLDADHMVGDLVAYERMVQRFGRVNRRGEGEAEVHVLLQRDVPDKKEADALSKAQAKAERQRGAKDHEVVRQFELAPKYRAAMEALPLIEGESARDASPEALRQLKINANTDDRLASVLADATTPAPLRPQLTRPILDSWSMTSLEKHSARPFVAPWLRGWVDDEPQTTVVWRKYLPTLSSGCTNKQIADFFEAAPIHLTEKLETRSDEVFRWLLKRVDGITKLKEKPAKSTKPEELARLPKNDDVVAILVDRKGDVERRLTLDELRFDGGKSVQDEKKHFSRQLSSGTLVVDSRIGGLSGGLLDNKARITEPAEAADATDSNPWIRVAEDAQSNDIEPIPAFRIVDQSADELNEPTTSKQQDRVWRVCYRLPVQSSYEDEPSRFLVIEKYRQAVTNEESRSSIGVRTLEDHLADTEREVARLATTLGLSRELTLVFQIAARNHDHGKNCDRWQNAFSAPEEGRPYAKTLGPFRNSLLDGYRHEFGSLPLVKNDPDFSSLCEDRQDLTLHLVAAHHGFGRPIIRTDGCEDAPPSALAERVRDVALRFARLQQQWGPWGLAWLESILRAADHRASALVDEKEPTSKDINTEHPESIHG
ncbi:type I-G CRISPR-associated helicase/endonuclease Cas3g [Allorhodopirellula solitaria]|nr:type I-U CRISPR-associated helicase/endonuclease Cas3 [Allorhodopirellula solitaria]